MAKGIFTLIFNEIAALSGKYSFWKVHWIGEVSSNGITRESLVDLWMVPYRYPSTFSHKLKSTVQNTEYDFSEMQVIRVGVGHLRIIGIGSFFKDGEPLARTNYISHKFKFTPTNSNQKVINLASYHLENGEKKFYVPTSQFRVNQSRAASYEHSSGRFAVLSDESIDTTYQKGPESVLKGKCILIEFNEDEQSEIVGDQYPFNEPAWKRKIVKPGQQKKDIYDGIIIPCMELIRFYYANSSQMFVQIFKDGLLGEDNRVFWGSKTIKPDQHGKNGFVWLDRYVTNHDLPYIARMAFDPEGYALKQGRNIYYSLLSASKDKEARVPEVFFPFKDQQTDLIVHGVPIQSGDKKYFLVYWIESCTAAFPFGDFEYWRNFPGGMRDRSEEETDSEDDLPYLFNPNDCSWKETDLNSKRTRYQAEKLEMESGISPSQIRAAIELLVPANNKFTDLLNKTWNPKDPEPEKARPARKTPLPTVCHTTPEPTELGSTAPRDGDTNATKATVANTNKSETGRVEKIQEEENPQYVKLFNSIGEKLNTEPDNGFRAKFIYLIPTSINLSDGNEPTEFPEVNPKILDKLKILDNRNRTTITRLARARIRIMEIAYQAQDTSLKSTPFYAHLFDIIPGGDHSDRHCLCLIFKTNLEALAGPEIARIIKRCLYHNGIWFSSSNRKMRGAVSNQILIKIRHISDQPQYYVSYITKILKKEISNYNK